MDRSRERLVEDWWAAGNPAGTAMIAQRRVDVDDLNLRARERMRDAGTLGERELWLPGGRFAVGDHVIVKRNDLQLGILNGERARVTAVDPEARRLTLDQHGETVTLGADYLDDRTAHGEPTLRHGYAITAHVAQGLTVDRAFVLAGPGLNRELANGSSSTTARARSSPSASATPASPRPSTWLSSAASTASATVISGTGWSAEQGVRRGIADTRAC